MSPDILRTAAQAHGSGYPHIYRVGAYVFFAWLSFWSAMPIYAVTRWLALPEAVRSAACFIALFATFFALRDMTKRRALPALQPDQGEG